jgi:hypothetical protein
MQQGFDGLIKRRMPVGARDRTIAERTGKPRERAGQLSASRSAVKALA